MKGSGQGWKSGGKGAAKRNPTKLWNSPQSWPESTMHNASGNDTSAMTSEGKPISTSHDKASNHKAGGYKEGPSR